MNRDQRTAARTASPWRWCTVGLAMYLGWAVANLLFLALLPLIALIALAERRRGYARIRRAGSAFLRLFFGRYAAAIGLHRFAELPDPAALPAGRCLFVANHASWMDALLALALFPGVRVPVNAAYADVPVLGLIIRWMGGVRLDKASPASLEDGLSQCRAALRGGESLFVFPEGRRSDGGGVQQFSDVFFRFALEADAPVVPVVMRSDVPMFTRARGSMLTWKRATWTIRVLGALPRDRRDRASDLRSLAQRAIARELRALDARDEEGRDDDGDHAVRARDD